MPKGAKPGNTNAVKHGSYSLLRALREQKRLDATTRRSLRYVRTELVRDQGVDTLADLPMTRRILVDRIVEKAFFCSNMSADMIAKIATGEKVGEGQMQEYLSASNSLRSDLVSLGLERKARDVAPTLDEIRRRYERPQGDGYRDGDHQDHLPTPQGEAT